MLDLAPKTENRQIESRGLITLRRIGVPCRDQPLGTTRHNAMSQPAPAPRPTVIRNALTRAQLAALRCGGRGWEGAIEGLPVSWRLGVVVGSPGSGKTSLLRCSAAVFGVPPSSTEPFECLPNKAVVSCMGASPDEAVATLQSGGLAVSLLRGIVKRTAVRRLSFSYYSTSFDGTSSSSSQT